MTTTFTYQRNKEDVLKFSVWHRMFKGMFMKVMNIVFPLFGLFSLAFTFTQEVDSIVYVAIAYLLLYPAFTYGLIRFKIYQVFKNPDLVMDTTTYTYGEAGINTSSDKGTFLLEWNMIHSIYEVKDYFYIYIDMRNAIMVNKVAVGEQKAKLIKDIMKEYADPSIIKFK